MGWVRGGIALRLLLIAVSIPAIASSAFADKRVYPGRYVVTLGGASSGPHAAQALSNPIPKSLSDKGLRVESYLGRGAQAVMSKPKLSALGIGAVSTSETAPFDPLDDTCGELLRSGSVSACSPDFEVRTLATPNDPSYGELYGLSTGSGINAPAAWDVNTGSSEVVVAVIDTGLDYTHPDLAENAWVNPFEVRNGRDDDGNGYIDDIHGANVVRVTGDPMDDNMHGTHVSGTIGARGGNGVGVVGVNWNVRIMGLKFLNADGSGSLSSAIKAIDYVVAMKQAGVNVRLTNNSWGGAGFSQPLADAIARANQAGVLFIAAAGNEGNDNDANPTYPSSFELPNVVSVAAVDDQRNLASFSNRGAVSVDIAAPGVQILSTTPSGAYRALSGTSMATPHVTGALALLFAAEPGLTNDAALARLYESGVGFATLTGVIRNRSCTRRGPHAAQSNRSGADRTADDRRLYVLGGGDCVRAGSRG